MKIEYLKNLLVYDLIRSLHARIRLLVEDLDARKDIIGIIFVRVKEALFRLFIRKYIEFFYFLLLFYF
jgi:hypothetical protein